MASMEGIAVTDTSVLLLADDADEGLLANDKEGLVDVARTHGVGCWWVTALLVSCTKE